jgi:16S rRNA (uracil1498-N3)-methyltransferase
MSLHRFYCKPITKPTTELSGSEAHHLISVLRLKAGQKVELFDGAGTVAGAAIAEIKKRQVVLRIEQIKRYPPRATGRIIIAPGIAKGERFDWLIEKCTELGIDRICPVVFERTVKQAGNPKIVERWMNLAISAGKQCGRLFLPKIDSPMPLKDVLKTIKNEYPGCRLLFGCVSSDSAGIINIHFGSTDVAVFIGPEGGLTDGEMRLLKENGAKPIRLTDSILRIETAAVALGAILCAQRDVVNKVV